MPLSRWLKNSVADDADQVIAVGTPSSEESGLHHIIKALAASYSAAKTGKRLWLRYDTGDLDTNGEFAADTDWTKGTGWTISGGTASSDGTQVGDSDLTQAITFVEGDLYVVEFTVSGYSAGNVVPVVGDTEGTDVGANGTYRQLIVAGSGADFDMRADATFVGSLDNVIVRPVAGVWYPHNQIELNFGDGIHPGSNIGFTVGMEASGTGGTIAAITVVGETR